MIKGIIRNEPTRAEELELHLIGSNGVIEETLDYNDVFFLMERFQEVIKACPKPEPAA